MYRFPVGCHPFARSFPGSALRFACCLALATVAIAMSCSQGQDLSIQRTENALDAALEKEWNEIAQPLMAKYCGDCHLGSASEGGVSFVDYDSLSRIRQHESTWEQIRGVIRAEAMPPPDAEAIPKEERERLMVWIDRALHEVDCGCRPAPPPVTLRRLNQAEYDHTVRDLFGVDLRPSKAIGFVSDDVGNGFDNQGEVLTLPPIAMEKYLQAAAYVSERVISTDREKFRKQSFDTDPLGFGQRIEVPVFVSAGKYTVSVRARFGDNQSDNCKAQLLMDDTVVAEWEIPPRNENFRVEVECAAGDHRLGLLYVDDADPEKRNAPNRQLIVESFRLAGPEGGSPAFPKEHERVVVAYPTDVDTGSVSEIGFAEATRRVFQSFLPRAYRRSVREDEVHAVMMVCQRASDAGYDYLESVRFGVQAALVSPQFLFRSETRVTTPDGGSKIDDDAIANRLSYFLWSSMPDDALLQCARDRKLSDPDVLNAQIERMLADPKSDALLSGFFAQWLGLRNLNKLEVDANKFPFWSERLRSAMIRETEMFCRSLLREGRIQDLLLADYTYVNPRLAEFYGVPFEGRDPSEMYRRRPGRRGNDQKRQGLYEDEGKWIRVTLPQNRRGILTQAAALALTSNPTRSSPVKRGRWILETVLGDPPPSAPPNVPSLEQAKADESASLRERLEIHRSNPSCAGCHKLMDPIGLGLENFDAIGRWRDRDGEHEIAAEGELVDGRRFSGPTALVAILSEREESVAKNFTQRLLTYAIGRGLQRPDRCDVDNILAKAKPSGYTIRSIVEGVVASDAFLQRSSEPLSTPTQGSELTHE